MTKTYTEVRQEAYFRAAIELYRLTVQIADENIDNPPEGEAVSEATVIWAGSLIEGTYRKARDLEDTGHEQGIASTRWERRLSRERGSAEARTAEGRRLKAAILARLGQS